MTAIITDNALINGENRVILNVPSELIKKRLYFSMVATNFSIYDVEMWLVGEGFGNAPNVLANAVYIPANDYLPNRSQWKYPHKLVLPPGGSIKGYARVKVNGQDWHELEDFHNTPDGGWDDPSNQNMLDNVINLSTTYAEVK